MTSVMHNTLLLVSKQEVLASQSKWDVNLAINDGRGWGTHLGSILLLIHLQTI